MHIHCGVHVDYGSVDPFCEYAMDAVCVWYVISSRVLVGSGFGIFISGLKNHPVYLYNGLMMIAVFFIVRPCTLTYLFYRLMMSNEDLSAFNPMLIALLWIGFIAGVVLNLYWFYKMITGALALLSKDKKATKAK